MKSSSSVVVFVLLTRSWAVLGEDQNESNQHFQEKFDHDLEAALVECSYPDTERSHGHNSTGKSHAEANDGPSGPHRLYKRSTGSGHRGAGNTQTDTYSWNNGPGYSQTDTYNTGQNSYRTSRNGYNRPENSGTDTLYRHNSPEDSQTDTYNSYRTSGNGYSSPENHETHPYDDAQNSQSSADARNSNSRHRSAGNTRTGRHDSSGKEHDGSGDGSSQDRDSWNADKGNGSSVFIPFPPNNKTSAYRYRYREHLPQNLHTTGTRLANYSRESEGVGGHPKVKRSTYDARSNGVPACTVLCVLATLRVVDARGVPVETSLVKLLEDGVGDRQRRHSIIQRVASCFKTIPTGQGDDNCSLAKAFTRCFGFKFDKKPSSNSGLGDVIP